MMPNESWHLRWDVCIQKAKQPVVKGKGELEQTQCHHPSLAILDRDSGGISEAGMKTSGLHIHI